MSSELDYFCFLYCTGKNAVFVADQERKGEDRKREKEGEKKGKKLWKR